MRIIIVWLKRLAAARAVVFRLILKVRSLRADVLEEKVIERPLIEMFQSADAHERQMAIDRMFNVLESHSSSASEKEETVNTLVKIGANAKDPGIRKHAISILDHFNALEAFKNVCKETDYLDVKAYVMKLLETRIMLASAKRATVAAAVVQSEHADAIRIKKELAGEELLYGAGFATGTNEIIHNAMRTLTELALLYRYGEETNALAIKTLRKLSESPDPLVKELASKQLGFVSDNRVPYSVGTGESMRIRSVENGITMNTCDPMTIETS